MAKEFTRSDRISSQIQRELAELVRVELDDSRLGMITIQAVEVARDFAHAKVFFTTLGSEFSEVEVTKHLKQAAPMLRHALASQVRMRIIPELHFKYDESIERGNRLSALIDEAVTSHRSEDIDSDSDSDSD